MCDYSSLNPSASPLRKSVLGRELQRKSLNYNVSRQLVHMNTTHTHFHFKRETELHAMLLTFTYISTAIQAADAQTILLLLEGLGRPVFSD